MSILIPEAVGALFIEYSVCHDSVLPKALMNQINFFPYVKLLVWSLTEKQNIIVHLQEKEKFKAMALEFMPLLKDFNSE